MHRRMSLGVGMLLLLVFLAGPASVSAEPKAASEASSVESFSLLDWAWDWVTSLVSDAGISSSGGGHLSGSEGGMFIDPNGNS
jgi:hypothetical protein